MAPVASYPISSMRAVHPASRYPNGTEKWRRTDVRVYIWRGGHVRNCVRQGSQISAHVGTNPTAVIVFMDRPCVRYSGHSIPARSEPNAPPGKHCGAGEQEANDSKEQFIFHVFCRS